MEFNQDIKLLIDGKWIQSSERDSLPLINPATEEILSNVPIANDKDLDNSLMLVTALAPHIGYDNSAKIAKNALKNNTTLKEEALKSGLINEKNYNKIVDPKKMIYPE